MTFSKIFCWLGVHKPRFIHPENDSPVCWAVIGQEYREECTRCGAKTDTFILTREMLP